MEIMKQYLLLALILISGCVHKDIVSIEPKYEKFVNKFVEDGNKSGRSIKIYDLIVKSIPSINEETIGQCERKYNSTPEVTISDHYWGIFSDVEREELIYHELGHCVLNRKHKEDTDIWGIPLSIMHPYFLPEFVYLRYREHYVSELFR